jgi:hypothetical protein
MPNAFIRQAARGTSCRASFRWLVQTHQAAASMNETLSYDIFHTQIPLFRGSFSAMVQTDLAENNAWFFVINNVEINYNKTVKKRKEI